MAWSAVAGQHAHNTSSGSASFTVTLPSAPTTGNVLELTTESFNGLATATTSVSGAGATWTEDAFGTYNDGGFQSRGSVWRGVVGASPTTTITVTVNNNGNQGGGAGSVQEYTGLDTTLDIARAGVGTSGGTPTITTLTSTANANELVYGGFSDDGQNVTPTGKSGSGFTERDSTGASAVSQAYSEDKDSGATGTQTANMSTSIGTFWTMTVSCLVATGGGGGGGGATYVGWYSSRGGWW
jgi:hypothetical protein